MDTSPQNVYAKCLPSHRGYPLWCPEPPSNLPTSYLRDGLQIGDVGFVDREGRFNVLLNITHGEHHELHRRRGGAPLGFEPISLLDHDIIVQSDADPPGCVITSPGIVRGPRDPHRAGHYEFTPTSDKGAILILPDGAMSHSLPKNERFRSMAMKHALKWYEDAKKDYGDSISNNSLYLITGFRKARSWSLASFYDTGNAGGRRKIAVVPREGAGTTGRDWVPTFPVEYRDGPGSGPNVQNQTVFISGFKIAVRGDVLGWLTAEPEVHPVPAIRPHKSQCPLVKRLMRLFDRKGDLGRHQNASAEVEHYPTLSPPPFHPSDLINEYLLDKDQDALVAVAHDSEWISLIETGEVTFEHFMQKDHLGELLSANYSLVSQPEDLSVYLRSESNDGTALVQTSIKQKAQKSWNVKPPTDNHVIITRIRVNDFPVGLSRMPIGFSVLVEFDEKKRKTWNKPARLNEDTLEWDTCIQLPSKPSAKVRLSVCGSFELSPMLGDGESLCEAEILVAHLLGGRCAVTFSPEKGGPSTPHSSVPVLIETKRCLSSQSIAARTDNDFDWETCSELARLTDHGHNALLRYRDDPRKENITASIEYFRSAISYCPPGHQCRSTALSNLAFAYFSCSRADGSSTNLSTSISYYRESLKLREPDHPDRPATLIRLAQALLFYYEKQDARGFNPGEVTELATEARNICATGSHERRAVDLVLQTCDLYTAMSLNSVADASKLIPTLRQAVEDIPRHYFDRQQRVANLGLALGNRYYLSKDPVDLNESITMLEEAIQLTPSIVDPPPDMLLQREWMKLKLVVLKHKQPEDITFQVTVDQLTLSPSLPKEHIHVTVCVQDTSKITCCGKLSKDGLTITWNHPFLFSAPISEIVTVAIWTLPEVPTHEWDKQPLGNAMVKDVASLLKSGNSWKCYVPGISGSAILSITCRITQVLIVSDGHDCLSAISKYSMKLYQFGRGSKNVAIISTQIEMDLARLDLCPLGHSEHTNVLNDLGVSFSNCYDYWGNIIDLNRAIDVRKRRLDLCPEGHPEHAGAIGELAMVLSRHYYIQQNKEDLNILIDMNQRWLNFCPLGHPDHSDALGSFARSLQNRYYAQNDITDLNRAIKMNERVLELSPPGHPDYVMALNDLADSLNARYRKLGMLPDLNRSLDLEEKSLKFQPPGHKGHGLALQNLALSLMGRYARIKDQSDLERAINLFRQALKTYPAYHRSFAFNAGQLAAATLLLSSSKFFKQSYAPAQQLSLVNEAFEAYKLLKECSPAASLNLLKATQDWVEDAEKHNHHSVLEAYQTLLSTLVHFTSLSSSLESRHGTMQVKVANAANDVFSCATHHGNLQMAVMLLEQGRGILWNQLARFDISVAMLKSHSSRGRELGRTFVRLSKDLKKYAQQGTGNVADQYWHMKEEWERVVGKIRSLDGFSRFLLPPHFDDLQRAAKDGPVVIVNASKHSCESLVVLHDRAPVHVPLGCSLGDVIQLCDQLSELTRDSHAYGSHRELYVKEVLRDLWTSVVERIAFVLENDVQLRPGSRIWWCPTSKFTLLPLHAAGPHRKGKKNFMDIYVSSYAPSLSALIRACDRIQSQRKVRDTSETPNLLSFVAVGQAYPSTDTGLGQLPEVEHEIRRIRDETNMPTSVSFESVIGPAAFIEGAIQAFRDHRWVHVACHGSQHAEKPFDSWFAMGDGKLTLMRIIQEHYRNSEFAFLSACHTAKGDASTPDEVLHLAAGMELAGFNGVIGTLWRVDDAIAHEVVTRFYKEMFKHPHIDFEHAAAALNTAVIETTGEVPLEKRIVFVHVGI